MKELNLNGFYKMCDKFSSYHKLDENETRRLYAFIGENFDDDFANYDIEADKSWHSICSHMFAMCSWMAFGSLEFPLMEKALFSERDFTHADFFNVAWYFGVMSRLNSSYVLFLDHMVSELNSVVGCSINIYLRWDSHHLASLWGGTLDLCILDKFAQVCNGSSCTIHDVEERINRLYFLRRQIVLLEIFNQHLTYSIVDE